MSIRLLLAKGRRIQQWASAPLDSGLVKDGLIADPQAVGAAIRQLASSSGMSSTRIVASVGGNYALCRLIRVASTEAKLSPQQVLQSISEAVPIPVEELHIAWQALARDELGQWIFVAGTPRNIIDAEVCAIKASGARPRMLTLKALAVLKLVEEPQVLVVNIEPDSLDIVLGLDGIPRIMRTISQGPEMSFAERIDELVQNIEQTTQYFELQHPELPVQPDVPIALVGRQADNPDIITVVSERTSHPLAPLTVPFDYPPNLPVAEYAVNIGLAIKGGPANAEKVIDEPTSQARPERTAR